MEARVHDTFVLADSAKQGALDKDGLLLALQYFGFAPTLEEFEEIFEEFASSGVIDLEAYKRLVEKIIPQIITKSDVLAKLRRFDGVDKGYLPVSELRQILCRDSDRTPQGERNKLIDNSVEGLTKEEFFSFIEQAQKLRGSGDDGRLEYEPIVSLLTKEVPVIENNKQTM